MKLDPVTILGDLLRAAADDVGVHLHPLRERRLVARMVELAELTGVEFVRDDGQ